MNRYRWGIALVCGILVGLSPLRAQVPDIVLRNPLQMADSEYESALANWGDGKSAANEALLKSALAIRREMLGAGHPSVADVLERLGAIDYNRGHYQLAEDKFRQALTIYTQSYGERSLQSLRTMGDLGAALREETRYADAQEIVERSVALRRETLGPDNPMLAGGLNNLGRIYLAQGQFAKARAAFEESLRIFKSGGADFEPNVHEDEALLDRTAKAEARASWFVLAALALAAVMALLGALMIGCTLAAERAYASNPPARPPSHIVLLLTVAQSGLIVATILFGDAVAAVMFTYTGGTQNFLPVFLGGGAIVAIGGILPLWGLLTNFARGKVGLPPITVTLFGLQLGQPPLLEAMRKPPGAAWWFAAFEYHPFQANLTIKMFVTSHALCGARLSRLMSGLWVSPLGLANAAFWTQSAQARAYDRLDPESEAFRRWDEANFQIGWKEVSSLEYIPGKKWAAHAIPHVGRLIVRLRSGESREFLLIGNQDGEDLARKLAHLRAEVAARSMVGSPSDAVSPSNA